MSRKRTAVNYRQLYKEHYHIEFGRDMVVHHIDFDRTNNSIDNLLLMPRWLHSKYHTALKMLEGPNGETDFREALMLDTPMVPIHYCMWLDNMRDALREIAPWIKMKIDYDMMPNNLYRTVYHTDCVITEHSFRDELPE